MDDPSDQLRRFIQVETDRAIWKAYLLMGDANMVWQMLNNDFIADEPLGEDMRSPLIDLALHVPKNEIHAQKLAETTRALISKGASLHIPDFKGLLPIDYALIGPNPLGAEELFINTLRGNFLDQNLYASYRPNLKILFCTTPDMERRQAYQNLLACGSALRDRFNQTVRDGDPYILGLRHEEQEFWASFVPPPLGTLPKAPETLTSQFHKIAVITAQSNDTTLSTEIHLRHLARLESAKDAYRSIEWETIRKMKF